MAANGVNLSCNCGKKSFATEAEAVASEIQQREQHHFNRQFAYARGKGNWHLSSKAPRSFKAPSPGPKLLQAANMVPALRKGPSRRSTEEIQERRVVVAQLHREGKTAQEIATFVGMGVSTIELDLQSMGIQPTRKRTYTRYIISVKDEVQRRLRMLHVRAHPVAGRYAGLRWFGQPACFLFPLRTVQSHYEEP